MGKIHLSGIKRRIKRNRQKIKQRGRNRPRLSVFRSSRYISAQIIDDQKGKTLVSVCEKELNIPKEKKLSRLERAKLSGILIGEKAKKLNISEVVFDRSGYKYHGRIKLLAEGARSSGLQF
ncbi:50S ribosomal protein L18 [Candidatus Gottesmanbacteria bacterium]|nr:50S ribosomal protein L18 [Candidatus Gottesmanbacteria bacterium]